MHRYEKWRQAIAVAPNAVAIEKLIREYVDCILPSEIANLPQRCQMILEAPCSDLPGSAVGLLHEELKFDGDAEARAVLHEIAHTFAAASTRLSQIQGRYPAD